MVVVDVIPLVMSLSRSILLVLSIGCSLSAGELISNEVLCDFEAPDWLVIDEAHVICYIRNQTIDNNGFFLVPSTNDSVKGLKISDEVGVRFIPEGIADAFPMMTVIEVHNCAVEIVGASNFRRLSELLSLNLNSNQIETVESGAFRDLSKLEHLSIGENKIEFLTSSTFKNLRSLKLLYLGDNKIQFLSENFLDELTSLNVVSFEKNRIESISETFFKNNLKLERIGLHENVIKHISSRTFEHLKNLSEVDLEENDCISRSYEQEAFNEMRKDLKLKCQPLREKIFENLEEIRRYESQAVQCKQDLNELMEKLEELRLQLNSSTNIESLRSKQCIDKHNENQMIANQHNGNETTKFTFTDEPGNALKTLDLNKTITAEEEEENNHEKHEKSELFEVDPLDEDEEASGDGIDELLRVLDSYKESNEY
jgi:Leucine rich repeat